MCGGDDHLAWKRPVSSEVCKGLRTTAYLRSFDQDFFPYMYMWVHLRAFRASLVTIQIQYSLFGLQLSMLRDWRVGGQLIKENSHQSSDTLVEMSDKLASILASIQEQRRFFHLGLHMAFHSIYHIILARQVSHARHERYSGIVCLKIHLRLYNTVMRAHRIDDAQLVALFPIVGGHQTEARRVYFFLCQSLEGKGGCVEEVIEDYGQILLIFLTTSIQPRPPHPRATTPRPPRPYAQRTTRQFTPLGMTLTRAFEKFKDTSIQGHDTERCVALHRTIQDLIDSRLVNLSRPSVTTNPLLTHSTHAVPPSPSL
ncbi:hypothetical protein AAG906_017022 [Vitis piasezkii]